MSGKKQARATYYGGAKAALEKHMVKTEKSVRALPGLEAGKADKLVAAVRKRHNKLIAQLDEQLALEAVADA